MSGWLTVAAVADELEVSPRTVLRWIERGDLAAVRLPGGRLRIAQAEVDAKLVRWSTMVPTDASGPAVREHPGPGKEG
jgi:excisionase family DNA binding protein